MRSNRLQPNPVQSPQAIDCDLSMHTHVQRTVSRCFTALRQIRRCVVGHTSDACGCTGALPVGLWEQRAGRPSGLPDASTRLIYRLRTTRDHITDALAHRSYLRSTSFNLKRIFLANLLRLRSQLKFVYQQWPKKRGVYFATLHKAEMKKQH